MADTAPQTEPTNASSPAPSTAPVPSIQTTVASLPFAQYLKTQLGNHLLLIGILVLIGAGIVGFNYVRDMRTELANLQKTSDTLAQKFQPFNNGASAVAANSQDTSEQMTATALTTFGAGLVAAMKGQHADIQSLTTSVGQVQSEVRNLTSQPTTFTPTEKTNSTGALVQYPLAQDRGSAPSLTSLSLSYDPTQTDPNLAFKGTTWHNNNEEFTASVGNWVKQGDGAMRTSVALQRKVTKPDPNDPSKTIVVGTETIPLTGSDTVYSPKGLVDPSSVVFPRWTASVGVSQQSGVSGYKPAATIDYRITDRFGLFAGAVNGAGVAGVSIHLGGKK
jgi:hypothetical protein